MCQMLGTCSDMTLAVERGVKQQLKAFEEHFLREGLFCQFLCFLCFEGNCVYVVVHALKTFQVREEL